jgi:uncharacterized protein YjbI with pentapeptide repeats
VADDEHVAILKQGVAAWNKWRDENPDIRPDLSGANLSGANLGKANLRRADLRRANLREANLIEADLRGANLIGANLIGANLIEADLFEANLIEANLRGANLIEADLHEANLRGASLIESNLSRAGLIGANLRGTDLRGADLRGASLIEASLIEVDLTGADLTGCHIYGVSAWGLRLDGATQQKNLVITRVGEREITVDNIEVAQFIYLMLHNQKIRDVIDTITSKAVLILGRFTDERKAVLEALREELRKRNYLPILFDFEKPRSRDTDETITLLCRTFARCRCNQLSSRGRSSPACSTTTGTGRRFCPSTSTPIRSN